jgi:hypothetical protein
MFKLPGGSTLARHQATGDRPLAGYAYQLRAEDSLGLVILSILIPLLPVGNDAAFAESAPVKPTIVLFHGGFADGSGFSCSQGYGSPRCERPSG